MDVGYEFLRESNDGNDGRWDRRGRWQSSRGSTSSYDFGWTVSTRFFKCLLPLSLMSSLPPAERRNYANSIVALVSLPLSSLYIYVLSPSCTSIATLFPCRPLFSFVHLLPFSDLQGRIAKEEGVTTLWRGTQATVTRFSLSLSLTGCRKHPSTPIPSPSPSPFLNVTSLIHRQSDGAECGAVGRLQSRQGDAVATGLVWCTLAPPPSSSVRGHVRRSCVGSR